MTKMIQVNLDVQNVDQNEAQEWANEIVNVYADMEVANVNISGNKISFQAGFSGMDDTTSDDVKQKSKNTYILRYFKSITFHVVRAPHFFMTYNQYLQFAVIGKEGVGKSQLISSLTGKYAESSNLRGSTVSKNPTIKNSPLLILME